MNNSKPINWNKFRDEVGRWSTRNFPKNKPHHPLLGIVEELGEFHQAASNEEREDALADATIYLADYCFRNNLEMDFWLHHIMSQEVIIGTLCHFHLKGEQGIRYDKKEIVDLKAVTASKVLTLLKMKSNMFNIDFESAVLRTWAEVSKRDWTKYKKDGKGK